MVTNPQHSARKFDRHFKDEICRQSSLEDTATILAEAAQALDWDLAAFHPSIDSTDMPRGDSGVFVAERLGWCSASLEGWRRFEFGRDCPIAACCARMREPFFWSCDDGRRLGSAARCGLRIAVY